MHLPHCGCARSIPSELYTSKRKHVTKEDPMPEDDDSLRGLGRAMLGLVFLFTIVGGLAAHCFSQMPDQPAVAATLIP